MTAIQTAPVLKVSPRALLSIYAIFPLCFLMISIDITFFSSALRSALPMTPYSLLLFTVFFNLPHIAASHLMFLDRDYLSHHYQTLSSGILIIFTLTIGIYYIFDARTLTFFALIYTVFHGFNQQMGINKILRQQKPDLLWNLAEWTSLATGVFIFASSFHYGLPDVIQQALTVAIYTLFPIALFCLWKKSQDSKTVSGKYYTWANMIFLAFFAWAYTVDYIFFLVFAGRVMHDLTAFVIYSVHDQNRYDDKSSQLLYKLTKPLNIPVWILCPVISITIALPLSMNLTTPFLLLPLIFIQMLHFFTESRVWRKGSVNRQYVPFNLT